MSAQILNGKNLAEKIYQQIRDRISHHLKQGHRPPGLAVVLIGNDPASMVYVRNKHAACEKVGILSKSFVLPEACLESDLKNLINQLNTDNTIDGILVQLPLPKQIQSQSIIEQIHPNKDVDGFHPYNLGRLAQRCPLLRPCTPAGIIELLNSSGLNLKGLDATVVGVSNIVGRPMILELLMAGCTVTACHRHTKDVRNAVSQAELLVVAAGSPGLIKGDWIKPGAIVIDVGMNRMDNGQFVGDVEFKAAEQRAAWITPVPGGVGPMTVATLLKNTLYAYESLNHDINHIAKREIL